MDLFKTFTVSALLGGSALLQAQESIKVGKGSYAEFPPVTTGFYEFATNSTLYHSQGETRALPTNDWWTDILVSQYGGNLWAYPMMTDPDESGFKLFYPNSWSGSNVDRGKAISVMALDFHPTEATAKDWSDSGFTYSLPDGDKNMDVTVVHGMPFTWIETQGITPQLSLDGYELINADGSAISETVVTDGIIIKSSNKYYGLHLPADTTVKFTGSERLIVDLGQETSLDECRLIWERAYGKAYTISVSTDNTNWTVIHDESNGDGGTDTIGITHGARYVTLTLNERGTEWPFSLYEFELYSNGVNVAVGKTVTSIDGLGVESTLTTMTDANMGSRWISGAEADKKITLELPTNDSYFVIYALTKADDFALFNDYAYTIPRDTRVDWNFSSEAGIVSTVWSFDTESLNDSAYQGVIQGFLPHHYNRTTMGFEFSGQEYLTGRGKMKMATGNQFSVTYPWSGLTPHLSAPVAKDDPFPFNSDVMEQLLSDYAKKAEYGTDTYWGGKDLGRISRFMIMAKETNSPYFEPLRDMLKEGLNDWFNYTPGEENRFFASYPQWGGILGFNESYGSGQFTDNHFHYGYFVYAAALLGMVDPDWVKQYEDILTMITRQYANWDRNHDQFPFMRTLDPWMGHSYAGGTSSGGGNNQESSSEATQSWAGMFFLGELLGNNEMRDAAAFGYISEAQATMEYWHDRSGEFFPEGYDHDITGILWPGGISYGTYFGDHPAYIYGIQWLPISPYLNYLNDGFSKERAANLYDGLFADTYNWYKDRVIPRDQANVDGLTIEYASLEARVNAGETLNAAEQERFEKIPEWMQGSVASITEAEDKIADGIITEAEIGSNWINIIWGYRLLSDPSYIAERLAVNYESSDPAQHELVRNYYTGALTYYHTHAMQNIGTPDFAIHMSIATSQGYYNEATGRNAYVVQNYSENEEICRVFRNGTYIGEFKVPANALVTHYMDEVLTTIALEGPIKTIVPGQQLQLSAQGFDQYEATFPLDGINYSVDVGGTIDPNGLFTATTYADPIVITASVGGVSQTLILRVADLPQLSGMAMTGVTGSQVIDSANQISVLALDQYGDDFPMTNVAWSVAGAGSIDQNGFFSADNGLGLATITAEYDGATVSEYTVVTLALPNLALGKTAWSDNPDTDAYPAVNSVDGDASSRWESAVSDNHWIAVDLGANYDLTQLIINWEPAFASAFDIEVSTDNITWAKASTGLSGKNGIKSYDVSGTGRYVRVNCITRATAYGFSIYELEVYGKTNVSSITPTYAVITPSEWIIEKGSNKQFKMFVYDGNTVGGYTNGLWTAEGGSITPDGVYSPTTAGGPYTITSTLNGVASYSSVYVTESGSEVNPVSNLAINATATASSIENTGTAIASVNDDDEVTRWSSAYNDDEWIALDLGQSYEVGSVELVWETAYGKAYNIELSDDNINWSSVYQQTNGTGGTETIEISGNAQYIRMKGLERGTAWGYSLYEFKVYEKPAIITPVTNLALNKVTSVTSTEADNIADNATDGDANTRWSSLFTDTQSIMVDLGENKDISRIILNWETASAKSYSIEISSDGVMWSSIYSTDSADGDVDEISCSGNGRYVRMLGTERNTPWGYSLWEIEVY